MSDLNLDIDYFTSPPVERLMRLLGKGSEVLPLKLWAYTAHHFIEDGRLTELSAQDIEEKCLWWGISGKMVEVMLKTGFLALDGDTYVVPFWKDRQGHLLANKERARDAAEKRWSKHRKERNAPSNPTSNAQSNAPSNAPTVLALPSLLSLEREGLQGEETQKPKNGEGTQCGVSFDEVRAAVRRKGSL